MQILTKIRLMNKVNIGFEISDERIVVHGKSR